MIENIAIKRIGFLNKKQREYTEYKLVQQAQNGCDESFEKLINSYKEYLYKMCIRDRYRRGKQSSRSYKRENKIYLW